MNHTTITAANANQRRSITKRNSSLPHLVIHLGPPKTETTTIQSYLSRWFVDGTLKRDRYTYLGNYVYEKTSSDHNNNNRGSGKKYNAALNAKRAPHAKLLNRLRDLECHREMNRIRRSYERKYGTDHHRADDDHHHRRQQRRQQRLRSSTLSQVLLTQSKCARDIVASFQAYSQKNMNLLYFDETLSNRNATVGNVTMGYQYYDDSDNASHHPTIFDWVSLHNLLQDYYQISVFVTYRRYYEWLPSAKYQVERYLGHQRALETWPNFANVNDDSLTSMETTMNILRNEIITDQNTSASINYFENMIRQNDKMSQTFNGRFHAPSLFPHWWKKNFPPGSTPASRQYYTDSVLRGVDQVNHRMSSSVSTKTTTSPTTVSTPIIRLILLNMHASISSSSSSKSSYTKLRSVFVCSLPNAPYLCQYSQQLDQEEEDGKVVVHKNPSEATPWYDQLVIHAARYGFINISRYPKSRQTIIQIAKEYHKSLISSSDMPHDQSMPLLPSSKTHDISGPTRSNHLSDDDQDGYEFPLQCPTVTELTEFLHESLRYEEMILPDYYVTNKEDHIHQFWNRVRDPYKNYCTIDPIKTLRQSHWQHFFVSLLPVELEQKKKKTTG